VHPHFSICSGIFENNFLTREDSYLIAQLLNSMLMFMRFSQKGEKKSPGEGVCVSAPLALDSSTDHTGEQLDGRFVWPGLTALHCKMVHLG